MNETLRFAQVLAPSARGSFWWIATPRWRELQQTHTLCGRWSVPLPSPSSLLSLFLLELSPRLSARAVRYELLCTDLTAWAPNRPPGLPSTREWTLPGGGRAQGEGVRQLLQNAVKEPGWRGRTLGSAWPCQGLRRDDAVGLRETCLRTVCKIPEPWRPHAQSNHAITLT